MRINPHPIYRRRRRIALLIIASVFALGFALVPDSPEDHDPCRYWPNVPPCTETTNQGENP